MEINEKAVLLSEHYGQINKILLAHGVPAEDREDLLHEVFIAAYKSLGTLRETEKMGSWLWKIAENAVRKYYRKRRRIGEWEIFLFDEEPETADVLGREPAELDQIADSIERMDQRNLLLPALKKLSRDEESLLKLYYGLGYSLVEIAEAQGKNYSSVKSMHIRALRKLRRIVEEGEE